MRHPFHIWEKVGAEGGSHGDGHKQTGADGNDVGEAQRGEDAAFDAAEGEKGNENKNDDEGCENDGVADFAAGREDDTGDGFWIWREAVFAQAAEDIFDIDDGVVHEFADGHGEASEGHGIDAESKPFENDERNQERERNGCERDKGRSKIKQK